MLSEYYRLTKPGIIRGNVMTGIGGFFLAANGSINWQNLAALIMGMMLVIGGSCVFNNVIDETIDRAMARTKSRALVTGTITRTHALVFGAVLSASGTAVLLLGTNALTTILGLIGLLTYVGWYTPAKHRTPYATLIGTLPGAIPPVAGYTAVTNRLDWTAALLFIILVCWQMPHFYAIAVRRQHEYAAAHVPIWPTVKGMTNTKRQMIFYAAGFVVSCLALSIVGPADWTFALVLGGIGLYWTYVCIQGLWVRDNERWAKAVFLLSLPMLPMFSLLLILQGLQLIG